MVVLLELLVVGCQRSSFKLNLCKRSEARLSKEVKLYSGYSTVVRPVLCTCFVLRSKSQLATAISCMLMHVLLCLFTIYRLMTDCISRDCCKSWKAIAEFYIEWHLAWILHKCLSEEMKSSVLYKMSLTIIFSLNSPCKFPLWASCLLWINLLPFVYDDRFILFTRVGTLLQCSHSFAQFIAAL